jgi:predicted O-linked N-acetylglucosamine transferase (SPINDLY family)
MSRQDIGPTRITFVPRTSGRDYFSHYCHTDIALDPFPYPGGTTTCDALWMGVPVITLAGYGAIARAGASILNNAGLPQYIANSPDHYIQLASSLASDRPRLRDLRVSLRQSMQSFPLMDPQRFTQDVEAAYRKMWTTYLVDGDCSSPSPPRPPGRE